jgi:hypothetical protein
MISTSKLPRAVEIDGSLILFVVDLYPLLRICRFPTTAVTSKLKERAKAVHSEHEAIVCAIEQRDPESAERSMRAHLAASRTSLMVELRQPVSARSRMVKKLKRQEAWAVSAFGVASSPVVRYSFATIKGCPCGARVWALALLAAPFYSSAGRSSIDPLEASVP